MNEYEKNILSTKYLESSISNDFSNFWQPLIDNTGIYIVANYRIYHNNRYHHMTNQPIVNKYLFSATKGKYLFDYKSLDQLFSKDDPINTKKYLLPHDLDINNDFWEPTFKNFKTESGIHIIEKFSDHYDCFWFIAQPNKKTDNFFFSNRNILENYILYFRETACNLVQSAMNNSTTWRNDGPSYCKTIKTSTDYLKKEKSKLININKQIKLKKYPIYINNNKIYITASELYCLKLLGEGYSHKKIGDILNISHRTVGTHILNIKNKLEG